MSLNCEYSEYLDVLLSLRLLYNSFPYPTYSWISWEKVAKWTNKKIPLSIQLGAKKKTISKMQVNEDIGESEYLILYLWLKR